MHTRTAVHAALHTRDLAARLAPELALGIQARHPAPHGGPLWAMWTDPYQPYKAVWALTACVLPVFVG